MFFNIILPYNEPNCWVPNVFSLHANLKKSMMILKKSLVRNESNSLVFNPLPEYLKRTYQKLQKDLLHDFAQSNK